jgi:glucoamylase
VQLDEVAFPVLLAALLAEHDALGGIEVRDMVQRALGFIVRNGPATEQDRWEEDAGVNTFTLAVSIAALVAGAGLVEPAAREFVLALADDWNSRIESYTAVYGSALARRLGVAGYYVRVAPPAIFCDDRALQRSVPIKNRAEGAAPAAEEQVSTDALQLVRFGLRRADDPLVCDTVKVIDALLRVDTPSGPAWRRYNGDGYGEHDDGAPFDGSGGGRPWPLLTGERGHYELAAGRDPLPYLEAMSAMTGRCGLIPEQVWDTDPIAERQLVPGKPSGSAMPLVWAHAEFIKLVASRSQGYPTDRPQAVWERYGGKRPRPAGALWMPRFPVTAITAGQALTLCLGAAARVRFGLDGWQGIAEATTVPGGLGLHVVDLPTAALRTGQRVDFALYWVDAAAWDARDYAVQVR